MRCDGRRDERLRLGLLEAERVALAGFVALVIVDRDFEGLRRQLYVGSLAANSSRFAGPPTAREVSTTWNVFLSSKLLYCPVEAGTTTSGARKFASDAAMSWARPRA